MLGNKSIYTIGHSTQSFNEFLELLKVHNINCVVDVRSVPYSQFASQFNQMEIKNGLRNAGITYIYMGDEFGARREEPELYDADGILDFTKTAKCDLFLHGISRIRDGVKKGYRIAFMCSEKEPIDCHRCILVGRTFNELGGFSIEHILIDGSIVNQNEISQILLEKFFPERNQVSLFDQNNKSEKELIEEAYKLQNKEIGYRLEK